MLAQVAQFAAIVANKKLGFNRISGKLLCYLIKQAGGVVVLEKLAEKIEDESDDVAAKAQTAVALLKSAAFLGKGSREADLSQDQAELLLALQPKDAPKPEGKPDTEAKK